MTQFADTFAAQVSAASKQAAQGCGCSDVLYEQRFHDQVSALLASLPAEQHAEGLTIATRAGYCEDFEPFRPAAGECALTGIDTDCCPCGRHE